MSNPPPSRRLNDEMHTNPSSPWKAVRPGCIERVDKVNGGWVTSTITRTALDTYPQAYRYRYLISSNDGRFDCTEHLAESVAYAKNRVLVLLKRLAVSP